MPESDNLVISLQGKLANGNDVLLSWPSQYFSVRKIYELNIAKMIAVITQGENFQYLDLTLKDAFNEAKSMGFDVKIIKSYIFGHIS